MLFFARINLTTPISHVRNILGTALVLIPSLVLESQEKIPGIKVPE